MDAIKFALETVIVGLLALPWLVLLLMLLLSRSQITKFQQDKPLSSFSEPTVVSIVIVTLAYFLGSAILPVSTQLLDDPDMPIRKIRQIKADLNDAHFPWFLSSPSNIRNNALSYTVHEFTQACHERTGGARHLTAPKWWLWRSSQDEQTCWLSANELFLLEEQVVLQQGTDKTERISRLHEQVIVLRGAVFNAFMFVSLCWFAYFSPGPHESIRARAAHLKITTLLLGFRSYRVMLFKAVMWLCFFSLLTYVSIALGKPDLLHHDITDPPIMESVLLVLAGIGLFTFLKGTEKGSHLFVTLLLSFGFLFLAYGAWQWTEVLYTENIVAAFFALH